MPTGEQLAKGAALGGSAFCWWSLKESFGSLISSDCPLSFHFWLCCRVLGLLEEGERQYRQLEDRRRAAHCAYLRALVQDALGQVAQRNADAASHGALLQPALD